MSFIRVDTNAGEVGRWLWLLADSIPDAVLFASVNKLADEALELYARTYKSWRHKPTFRKEFEIGRRKAEVVVLTHDDIYRYVDLGTSAHYIVAVDAPMLVYPEVYIPKTMPGVLDSGPASDQGPIIRRTWVRHPGARARGFSEEIQKRINRRAMPVFRSTVLRWLAGAPATGVLGIIGRFRRALGR